jgi:hypothetical protein
MASTSMAKLQISVRVTPQIKVELSNSPRSIGGRSVKWRSLPEASLRARTQQVSPSSEAA